MTMGADFPVVRDPSYHPHSSGPQDILLVGNASILVVVTGEMRNMKGSDGWYIVKAEGFTSLVCWRKKDAINTAQAWAGTLVRREARKHRQPG